MVSKADVKLIRSLKLKKFRDQEGLFVVEGAKMVKEAITSTFRIRALYAQEADLFSGSIDVRLVTEREMSNISHLATPSPALALVEKENLNAQQAISDLDPAQLYLGLDTIRDPGNMGTIIRIADWFCIKAIFASPDTVDLYNSKVIQASMGAIFRVPVHYIELEKLIDRLNIPVWGTDINGVSIYEVTLSNNGIIIVGNEANGISVSLQQKIKQMLSIPSCCSDALRSESLNAAIATAIICAEFRRSSL